MSFLFGNVQAQKLEERDEDLRKQDALYREQINKLEEKARLSAIHLSCQLYPVAITDSSVGLSVQEAENVNNLKARLWNSCLDT